MPPLPPKKDVALALLEKGSIFVHLDPRRDKVVVPRTFLNQAELVLQFGTQMRIPVPDLEVDDECISGTLSFARRPFWCRIPWGAVYGLFGDDRRGLVWNDDVPPENRKARAEAAPEPKRSHLRAVPSSGEVPAPVPTPSAPLSEAGDACSFCNTPWSEDASSCPVCGAARPEPSEAAPPVVADVPHPAGDEPAPSPDPAPPPSPDDPPPSAPPPKRPHLRLVK